MRSNFLNRQGSTSLEKAVVIILFVIFMVAAFIILANVFHFSLFGIGQVVPNSNNTPAVCALSFINYSTPGSCTYLISASSGSPGIIYNVYENYTGKLGSYVAGESAYSQNITLYKPPTGNAYYKFVCNTSGSNVSQNGFFYSAGGETDMVLPC